MKNSNDNFIVKIFKNEKSRSAIFLLFWIIFIVWIYVSVAIPYQKNLNKYNNTINNEVSNVVEGPEDELLLFQDYKGSLLKYNFDYVYTVNNYQGKTIYKGTMFGNETTGYKETASGIEKYLVRGTKIYKINMGEIIEQYNVSTNVYNGYLSVDRIMDLIEGVEYEQNDNQYTFQIESIYVKILVDEYNITSIEVVDGDSNYLLEFDNVNEIKELTY